MTPLFYLLAVFLAVVLAGILWRLFSRRQELPCPAWLGWMVEMENPFTRANRSGFIIEQAGIAPGMKVLDAGCGPGRVTVPAARAAGPQGEVWAVDVQQEMLDMVREKAGAAGLENIHFQQAALGEGKLPQDTFDRAVLVTVLGEIPDQVAALKEIFSALKPGGVLSISEVIFDPHFQRREHVLAVAEQAGFVEKGFFGKKLAYIQHLEKPVSV